MPINYRSFFDYTHDSAAKVPVGSRVLVPLGKRRTVGIVVERSNKTSIPLESLRDIHTTLDDSPIIPKSLLRSLVWTAHHYQQPIGRVLWTALPTALRSERPLKPKFVKVYRLIKDAQSDKVKISKNAPVQAAILKILKESRNPVERNVLKKAGTSWSDALRRLEKKGLVVAGQQEVSLQLPVGQYRGLIENLTDSQAKACQQISLRLDEYCSFLLRGVTGSGKTEVYFHVMSKVLKQGGQVLMLVPEIGLTPQLEDRVQRSLGVPVFSYHSGLSQLQKHQTWWLARSGEAKVVIGTRSAVFLAFHKLALIVLDEEHDASYKQQKGVRYHARSVSVHRAATDRFPLICGSATPSLETVHAANCGRLETLDLPKRATNVQMPSVRLIDLNLFNTTQGLSFKLLKAIEQRIENREQSLIFVNRRGFAPVMLCLDCKWVAKCRNCDTNLIYHSYDNRLHCHRCLTKINVFEECPDCTSFRLETFGEGTQQVETKIKKTFPGARVIRIDRDTTRSYSSFEEKLKLIQKGHADVLIGTQMLSKGHHFPKVTLVGILNVDQSFYSMDFRAMEHMAQQVLQVAGRAGRMEKPGQVLIQTIHPDSEIFDRLRRHDYLGFADMELSNRKQARQPPFAHYALLRANSLEAGKEFAFLQVAHSQAEILLKRISIQGVRLFDIVQSPIQKLSNRHRAQFLVAGSEPLALKQFLSMWMNQLEKIPKNNKLLWELDVDPIDFA